MALTKVSTDGVKDDAITKSKIPANQIEASELADNAVDTAAIADNAVTTNKIGSEQIVASNIAGGTITAGKLASGVQTTINNNADNRVITGSGTANTLEGESNLVFDGTNLGLGAVASGAASIGQDKLDIRGGGIYLNSQSTALSGTINKINFLKLHPSAPSVSYEMGRIAAYTENGYGAGGLDFYYGKSVGGGNYASTHGIRLDHQGSVGIGLTNADDYDSYANQLVVYGAGHAGMTIRGNYANTGNIYFADGTSGGEKYDGFVSYSYPTQRLALGAGGTTRVRVTTDGLTFGSDTAAANALDDYETGTWSPQIYYQNSGDQSDSTNLAQYGWYQKVGNVVHVSFFLRWSLSGSAANDNIGVKNFPFIQSPVTSTYGDAGGVGSISHSGTDLNATDCIVLKAAGSGSTLMYMEDIGAQGNRGNEFGANNAMRVWGSVTFRTT